MANPTNTELGITQNDYNKLVKTGKLAEMIDVRNSSPNWNYLGRNVAPAVASVLMGQESMKRTAAEMTAMIAEETALHPGENAGAEFGWGDDLAILIKTGKKQYPSKKPVPTPKSIDLEAAKAAIAALAPLTIETATVALEALPNVGATPPVQPADPAFTPAYPATTDPVEVLTRVRRLYQKLPPIWPDGTETSSAPEEIAYKLSHLDSMKVQYAGSDIALEILEFKAAFEVPAPPFQPAAILVDLGEWHGRTWVHFVEVFANKTGYPSGVAEPGFPNRVVEPSPAYPDPSDPYPSGYSDPTVYFPPSVK